jgi:hypothetical protein
LVLTVNAQACQEGSVRPKLCRLPQPGGIPGHGQFMPKPYGATTLVRHIHDLMRTLRR